MATARERKSREEEGLRTAGKFADKRFFRKPPKKPYDRPPTTLRTSGNNSWILKLVDPAQRLISSGSQMLFSSVFRNFPHRLPSRTSSPESSQSRRDDKKADVTDPFEVQVAAANVGDNQNRADRFVMVELEKAMKQKTFTRSEIDHLTALMHSKNVDLPDVNEEKRVKFISSIPESNRNEFKKIPNSEVRMCRQSFPTPILSSSVLDEDISSPAEIARAYMGSRQPKICPSMPSLRAQGLGENSARPTSTSFSSKSTDMLLVPSSTNQGLKRRSSFFDNHIGPNVPLRRIGQKPNIHLSKGSSLPVSTRPISVPVDRLSFDASQSSKFGKVHNFPSSIWNSQLSLKPKKNSTRKFIMNVESDNIRGAGSSSIYTPSRSYKMASKILEQLDKLTPPKEKVKRLPVGEISPPKLSPFTVDGHLKIVKDVDLPRDEELVHDNKQSISLHGVPYHDNQENTSQNKEKLENMKPSDPHHRCALLKDSGSIGSSKDSMIDLGVPAPAVVKSIIQPPKNKLAFQMWPDKDRVDQDESSPDRVAPATAEDREGDISLAVRQTTANETLAPSKPQTASEVIVGSPLNRSSDLKTSEGSVHDDMDTSFTFQIAPSQPETIDSAPTNSFGNNDLPEKKRIDSPVFSFGNNVSPRKQPNASSTAFDVGNKDASRTELCAAPENGNGAPFPYTQWNPASSYSDVQGSVYLNAVASSNHKLDCSWGTCNDAFSSSASISAGLAVSFCSTARYQSLNNGLSISCPSQYSSCSLLTPSMGQSSSRYIFLSAKCASNDANITTNGKHPSTTNVITSSAPSAMGLGTHEDKIKQDASLHIANNTYFSSISTPANSHYNMFSFNPGATPSFVNNHQLSTPTVSSAPELSAQGASAGKEFTANAEQTSILMGSFMSHASSAMAGKASISSGISFGCSSPASELFHSGSRPSEFPITGFTCAPATSTHFSTPRTHLGFESFTGASFSSICSTTSAAAIACSSSKTVSSNSHPTVAFRVSTGNNDCEDQGTSKDNVPIFSQKPVPPPSSGFSFGQATSESNPFLVQKQQTLAKPQNSSPYIAHSSSLEARGSFPLSAGGGNKASRRLVKVKRKK
ncbi:nuclear pore complex protein NUP1-like isoform X1 [Cucurbita moschata]|uniref:Nuclear pore complex protein NUP1-like isoform X1 n=1 Tax=Cucurbita moschata TaxID=3662 RepID=A0A6J1GWT8_CUCMO|nr:nuclear pore complex protein NUP1-like isoform X1 [Cucurbita moschata]XP_022956527.1 nuclear pore complex protein NUP1-like isoform X1 [Cucurbita moschata]XP_022956528.1 nuclear pore complex protein NUP1-like isoform X1 [Cucurbita moschata]